MPPHKPVPPPGFTLIELIVAVTILIVVIGMVGVVFKITGDTTSQATAVTGVHRHLRQVRATLQADLEGVVPERSALAIVSVLVDTFETPQDRTNNKPSEHRADVLMFFTDRPSHPYADANSLGTGPLQPVQVVYGHANLDVLDPASNPPNLNWLGPRKLVEGQPPTMNASEWHVARRVVFFQKQSGATSGFNPGFLNDGVLDATSDVVPGTGNPNAVVPFDYDFFVANAPAIYKLPGSPFPGNLRTMVQNWTYTGSGNNATRTVLDRTPPGGKTAQMAYYFLPGCADFKVEYTYDDPTDASAIQPTRWIDPYVAVPTDRRMAWLSANPDEPWYPPPPEPRPPPSQDQQYVDGLNNAPDPPIPPLEVRMWPKAIRVSMRVFDERGFLATRTVADPNDLDGSGREYVYEPVEFVYVHTF